MMSPTELKLRKIVREYILKHGPPTENTILVLSPDMWSNYIKENKLGARVELKPDTRVTFENITLIISNLLPPNRAYLAEESKDERRDRERFQRPH